MLKAWKLSSRNVPDWFFHRSRFKWLHHVFSHCFRLKPLHHVSTTWLELCWTLFLFRKFSPTNRCIMWAWVGITLNAFVILENFPLQFPPQIVASCEHRVGGWPPAQSWSQMTRWRNRRGGRLFVFSDSTGIRDTKNTWSQTTRKQLRGGLRQQIKLIFPFKGNKTKISSFGHKQLSGNLS